MIKERHEQDSVKSSPSGRLICEIPPIKKRLTALNTQMDTITEKHSIYILTSLREGLRYQPFSTSILSPVRKFVALSNAGRRRSEKCVKGYGSDNKVPDPSQTSYRLDVLKKFSLPTGEETHVM